MANPQSSPAITPFWLVFWACTLALGWLLPNHQRPWTTFHADAWVALSLSLVSAAVILRSRGPMVWHRLTVLVALLVFIPWIQYVVGMVPLVGNAWIGSAYLLGLLLALLTGALWESSSPGQLADGLFIAIGVGAVLSVGLQLQQWLGLEGLELWTVGGGFDRPYANFAQPNQLATFLLWGVLAVAWGLIRERLGTWTALLIVLYLLFGLALTGTRTAWVAVTVLVGATWLWRGLWTNARLPWIATGLGIYFLVCVVGLRWLHLGNFQAEMSDLTRMSGELRPLAWATFLDAIWQRPFFGYGWNQVVVAQLTVATEHPNLRGVFSSSHNLFLDLVLWCGIPLGLLISVCLLWWFWKRLRAVDSAENAVLLLFLLVVVNHAMLELPLQHAYFLLPAGMVMGALHARMDVRPLLQTGRWALVVLWLAATTLLSLIIRDYFRVEQSYQILRMEWESIKITMPVGPPEVLLLTQWRDYIGYARFEPKTGLTEEELDRMRNVTTLFPNIITLHKLATSLALNQQPEEARLWLARMCKVVPDAQCHAAKKVWAKQSLRSPEIAAIPWPDKTAD
jgi:O-antigen ligase